LHNPSNTHKKDERASSEPSPQCAHSEYTPKNGTRGPSWIRSRKRRRKERVDEEAKEKIDGQFEAGEWWKLEGIGRTICSE
jgi:hypothetical protein